VSVLCPVGHPLTLVSDVEECHPFSGFDSLPMLRRLLLRSHPDVVIPCDDEVVTQLHALHASTPELRGLVERSLGAAKGYPIVDNRYDLLSAAASMGIQVPRTIRVSSANDLADWNANVGHSGVLKLDGTCGGTGVRVFQTLEESVRALDDLRKPIDIATTWKRMIIDRYPLAFWAYQNRNTRDITVQEFITGRPANSMFTCHMGQIVSIVSVVVIASEGPTGAATVVRLIENEEMTRAATLLASRLELTGFYGLDYMLDTSTGKAWLLEMNPRCSQLGHLELPDQGSLAGAFCAALRGQPRPPARDPISLDTIAMFPQAINAKLANSYIAASHHDVPWDEVALVRELLNTPRPQRAWLARLYHALRPMQTSEPFTYENIGMQPRRSVEASAARTVHESVSSAIIG
jgi:hypothetical protein